MSQPYLPLTPRPSLTSPTGRLVSSVPQNRYLSLAPSLQALKHPSVHTERLLTTDFSELERRLVASIKAQ